MLVLDFTGDTRKDVIDRKGIRAELASCPDMRQGRLLDTSQKPDSGVGLPTPVGGNKGRVIELKEGVRRRGKSR